MLVGYNGNRKTDVCVRFDDGVYIIKVSGLESKMIKMQGQLW